NFKSVEAYYLGGYVAWKQGDQIHADSLFSSAIKYAKPADAPATKVIGEGDTKHGKGPHKMTSHSVFHTFISGLKDVDALNLRRSMEREYKQVDAFLGQYRLKIHQ
ncbi:MAG TPA: hypothetical protein VJ508_17110, partial [Saprospiraceae bacterium]|nr:hypothetical protein [Saprospiraceae bacterium]